MSHSTITLRHPHTGKTIARLLGDSKTGWNVRLDKSDDKLPLEMLLLEVFRGDEKLEQGLLKPENRRIFYDHDGQAVLEVPAEFKVAGPPRLIVTVVGDSAGSMGDRPARGARFRIKLKRHFGISRQG